MTDLAAKVQATKARKLWEMHHGNSILVLPNAWDAISARIFEDAGFEAIATTSVGVSVALGYADGHAPCDEVVEATSRIVKNVHVPVTADIESGFGDTSEEIVRNIEKFLNAGVVGINIEDSTRRKEEPIESIQKQAEKIRAIRELANSRDIPLVINARTDVFLQDGIDENTLLTDTFQRAKAYLEAGADCIYVFGSHNEATIRKLVAGIDAPINILAGATIPSATELQNLGVARVSIGGGAIEAALGLVKRIATELKTEGTYTGFTKSQMSYREMNGYFS
jgi:2-methylisocitrate lyase-like PEP mutase family enzyme